jgi:tetratricopeptide (TPR) repeat protein
MPQVFVSHSARDREFVEREIIAPLRQNGVATWYSEDNIATAAEWEERIRQGLKGCEWFLVAVSMNAVKSEWVQVEVDWAVDNRPGKLIPVMIETCDIDDLHLKLRRLQYIDFRKDIPRAQDKLLAIWGLGKAKQVELRYQKALEMIGAEDWCEAVEMLEEVMELDPSHTRAPGDLNWARQKQLLAEQYQKSITDLGAGRWDDAITNLQAVRKIDIGYKDVDQLIRDAQTGRRKARAEREAEPKPLLEPEARRPRQIRKCSSMTQRCTQ